MAHGYGAFTFGLIQAEREAARLRRFKERWQRLIQVHQLLTKDFLQPLIAASAQLTATENDRLCTYMNEVTSWCNAIAAEVNEARQQHLSRYACALKKTALKAFALCKKYGVYKDIETFDYVPGEKTIVLNGRYLYDLG